MKLLIVLSLCLPVPTWAAAFALSKHLQNSPTESQLNGGIVREAPEPMDEEEEEAVEETEEDEYSDPSLDSYEPIKGEGK